MGQENWVVVAAKPGQERRAVKNIDRQSFRPYQPLFFDWRRKVRRPLFGRYLFADLGPDRSRWSAIHGTYGVLYVITNNGELCFVPSREIARIKAMENENRVIELPRGPLFSQYGHRPSPVEKKNFRRGQMVRITGGDFAGETGLFEGMTVKQCEAVLLGWLGRALIPLSQLEAA